MVWDSAHVQLQQAVRRQRTQADAHRLSAPPYQPGDKVCLSTWDIRLRLPCHKLSPRFISPFTIKKPINEVSYQLDLPPTYRITLTFHVSLLKPHTDPLSPSSPGPDESEVPPPPEIENEESIYRVNTILDSRRRGGRLEYLVDWEDYGPEERSWVPRDDILDPSLLAEFRLLHSHKPAPRGRSRPRCRQQSSGAARGGGGTVSEPSASSSPNTQHTRSQSPEY